MKIPFAQAIVLGAMLVSSISCQEQLGGGIRSVSAGTASNELVYGIRAGKKLAFALFTDIAGEGTVASAGSRWKGYVKPKQGPSIHYQGTPNGLAINGTEYDFTEGKAFLVVTKSGALSVEQLDLPLGDDHFEVALDALEERTEIKAFLRNGPKEAR